MPVPLLFHINFRIILSLSIKKILLQFWYKCVKSLSVLGELTSLLLLNLPIHKHSIYFFIYFLSSLISFISIVWLSSYKSYFVRFTPKYLILLSDYQWYLFSFQIPCNNCPHVEIQFIFYLYLCCILKFKREREGEYICEFLGIFCIDKCVIYK